MYGMVQKSEMMTVTMKDVLVHIDGYRKESENESNREQGKNGMSSV